MPNQEFVTTYSDASLKTVTGVEGIYNTAVSATGNVTSMTVTKSSGISVSSTGAVAQTGVQSSQVIQNSSFDLFGNPLSQTITTTYYNSTGTNTISTTYTTVTNTYDTYNRVLTSSVRTYRDSGDTTLISLQNITYSSYDTFGNAQGETVLTYGPDGVSFAGASKIARVFASRIAESKGVATLTTTTKYSDAAMRNPIEYTVTTIDPSNIDSKGNPLVQDQSTYVYSGTSAVKITRQVITANSSDFLSTGDASSEIITT